MNLAHSNMMKYLLIVLYFLVYFEPSNGVTQDRHSSNYCINCSNLYSNYNESVESSEESVCRNCPFCKDNQYKKYSEAMFKKKFIYPIAIVSNYGFLYDYIQYAMVEYRYVVYADEIGYMPAIKIDFGNGHILKQDTEYNYVLNFSSYLNHLNILSMDSEPNKKYLYYFKHTYKHSGTYNLTVKVYNSFYEILHTTYLINVIKLHDCNLQIVIHNNAKIYYRHNQIYLLGVANSKCYKPHLLFNWQVFRLPSSNQRNMRLVNIPPHYCNNSFLTIPQFSLSFGKYHVIFSVHMLFPSKNEHVNVSTFFEIKKESIVLTLEGGNILNTYFNSTTNIRSKAFDPNFENDSQPRLLYLWKIKSLGMYIRNLFSNKEIKLNNSVLTLPGNTFKSGTTFLFSVTVSNSYLGHAYSAEQFQKHHFTFSKLPTIQIICVHNCLGNVVNADQSVTLEFAYKSYANTRVLTKTWNVYKNTFYNNDVIFWKSSKDHVDRRLILEKGLLRPNSKYRIELLVEVQFSDANKDYSESTLLISTHPKPIFDQCILEPSIGYGLFTSFNVNCHLAQQEYQPLMFELMHIRNFYDQDWFNIPIGMNTVGRFSNVILAQGLEEYYFVTTLRVFVVFDVGTFNYYDINVTVFPIDDYLNCNQNGRFNELNALLQSEEESLVDLMVHKNYYGVMNRISAISATVSAYLSTPAKISNLTHIENDILKLKHIFLGCIRRFPIYTITQTKYALASLHSVIIIHTSYNHYLDLLEISHLFENIVGNFSQHSSQNDNIMKYESIYLRSIILNVVSRIIETSNDLDYRAMLFKKQLNNKQFLERSLTIVRNFLYLLNFDKDSGENTYRYSRHNLAILSQQSYPENLLSKSERILELGGDVLLDVNKVDLDNGSLHNLIIVSALYQPKRKGTFHRYTLVNLTAEQEGSVLLPVKVEISPGYIQYSDIAKVHGNAPIVENIEFEDIQTFKMLLPLGAGLLVKFNPMPCNITLSVVHTVNRLPEVEDFFGNESIRLPLGGKANCSVLTHVIYKNARAFLPFGFSSFSVLCVNDDHPEDRCNVEFTAADGTLKCICEKHKINFRYQPVASYYSDPDPLSINTPFRGRVLLIFIIVYVIIVAVHFGILTLLMDRSDANSKQITYLEDNYPTHKFTYFVVVYTGISTESGTTSNIAISLEGTNATSIVHILKSSTKQVLQKAGCDWFLLKTMQHLGEIYCIHLWTDYIGARPSWYCDRIVIHDTLDDRVWFFIVQQWLTPFYGNGYLSVSIYLTSQSKILSTTYKFNERFIDEFESGTPSFYSVLKKHPYSTYKRVDRVALAVTNIFLLMFFLAILQFREEVHPSIEFIWDWAFLLNCLYAALLAQPITCTFLALFRCIKPAKDIYNAEFLFMCTEHIFVESDIDRFSKPSKISLRRQSLRRQSKEDQQKRKVSFKDSFADDVEQDTGRQVRSRHYFSHLEHQAVGTRSIVPLREHLTHVEDNTLETNVEYEYSVARYSYSEAIQHTHCLPNCTRYVLWGVMICIWIIGGTFSAIRDYQTEWVQSVCFCFSLFIAVLITLIFLEPLKWLISTIYLYCTRSRDLYLEDRSELISAVVPPELTPEEEVLRTELLDRNQTNLSMYQPIRHEVVERITKNSKSRLAHKNQFFDLYLLIMITIFITNIIKHADFLHRRLHYEVINDVYLSPMPITTVDDIKYFLKEKFIATLLINNDNKDPLDVTQPNQLVGVIFMKQIRFDKDYCKSGHASWAARCNFNKLSTKDFSKGWKDYDEHSKFNSYQPKEWMYKTISPTGVNFPFSCINRSLDIPLGGYVQKLPQNRRRQTMNKILQLLADDWIDHYTAILVIDSFVVNLNMQYLTKVTTIIEKGKDGWYHHDVQSQLYQMIMEESSVQMVRIVMTFFLFTFIVVYIIRRSKRLYNLKYDPAIVILDFLMTLTLSILSVITVIGYFETEFNVAQFGENLDYDQEDRTEMYDRESYYTFDTSATVLGFMMFIVILRYWSVLCHASGVVIAVESVRRSLQQIVCFFVILEVFIMAFATFGILAFSPSTYGYHTLLSSILSVTALAQLNGFGIDNSDSGEISIKIIFFVAAISMFTILKFLIASILIYNYQFISLTQDATLRQRITGDSYSDYSQFLKGPKNYVYFNLYSLPKPVYEYRLRAMYCLAADAIPDHQTSQQSHEEYRESAMAEIALGKCSEILGETTYQGATANAQTEFENREEFRREYLAKQLARTHVAFDALTVKLDYLDFQIKQYMRREKFAALETRTISW